MHIALVAGEPSGDRYAAELLKAWRRRDPDLTAFGLGGPRLREAGADLLGDLTTFAVMGFVDPLRHYPKLMRWLGRLVERVRRDRPDVVMLVDYPGFNLRVADRVSRLGVPVVYFMAPQVWGWGEGRLKIMRRSLRGVIVGLPFEEAYFRRHGLSAVWVGHPLVDLIPPEVRLSQASFTNRHSPMVTVGLFPGSRVSEVKRLWPVMREALSRLRRRYPALQGLVAKMPELPSADYGDCPTWIEIVEGRPYEVMARSDLLVVASGTATLEAAFFGRPIVATYKLGAVSYQVFRRLVKVRHISLVNLVADRTVIPELIQREANPEAIERVLSGFLDQPQTVQHLREELAEVVGRLGKPGVFDRAVEVALACL